ENDHISNIDNLAFLLGAGLLFFAIAYLLRSLRKRMKLQDHLVTAKEEVERTARIKEQFLANMSHEIRTPLQAILGYTNLLAKEKLTDRQAQYVHNIQLAGENLLSIVNDILDVSKIESGMVRLEELPFSLSGLLHSVDSMFQPKVAEKDIYLRLHPNLKIPSVLIGDPTRLTQILVNLINNAVKFTEKGGIDIFHKITKKTPEKVWLEIQVKDTGVGIAPEKLPHIFDRFEQADSKVTRMYGGSGLGLYIVKQLVEMQGGTISVESEPGRGSVFKVEIPYKVADEKALRANPAPGLVDLAKNFSDLQLLLVEDNLMNQRVVGMFLSGWGIDFDIADNGKSAIQLLEKNKYDLILMDVQMPEMDGYSATEYIRQNMGITTPIIAMTAHAFAGEREKALSYGMNEYISKPIKEEALYKMIARFVPLVREASAPSSTTSPPAAPATTTSNGPAIDYNFLMQSSKGKKEYLKNILELFLQQAPLEVAAMEMALADGRFADVGKTAHSLKSTVGYAGMDDSFRPLLESIEKKARSADNPGQLEPLVRQLKELLNDALLKIREEAMPLTE
ncbi:MAG TPA: response regulator, partial [Bacteroidetes bacterium]|nr:response regulator [Bacteroidota bacterium]